MAKRKSDNIEFQLNPFFELSDAAFEDLCRDLFAKSSEVRHARKLFGKGYKQFGGDILIQAGGGATSFVAQCKHYPVTDFSRGDIETAVNLFVSYWESHWKKFDVTKFYLIVARPLSTDDQLLTVQEQRKRLFEAFGVELIYWDSRDLAGQVKPHRDLVKAYLGEYWEKTWLPENGASNAAGLVGDPLAERLLNRDFEQMGSILSDSTRRALEPIRKLARTGRQTDAFVQLSEIKTKSFDYLDGKTRAEILSLEIKLGFPRSINAVSARQLLKQIEGEDSEFQTLYLDALITSREEGYGAALDKLVFCPDVSTFNLKLTLLINVRDYATAEREYQSESVRLNYDAETKRLRAAALLNLGRTNEAENLIDEVFAEQPDWEGIRLLKAIIYYFSALATPSAAKNPLAFPQPQPWYLIKTDDQSQLNRREAAAIFRNLLEIKERDCEERRILQTWHLACLADDSTRQSEAIAYCRALLNDDAAHPYALIWAMNRNFEVDFSLSIKVLANRFSAAGEVSKEEINEAIILIPLYLRAGEFEKAASHLAEIKPTLNKIGNDGQLDDYWQCQIEIARTGGASFDERTLNLINDAELRRSVQLGALGVRYQKNPSRANRRVFIRRLLKQYRKFGDVISLYNYCLLCHEQKNWREIAFYGETLLERIPTPEVVKMTANAFYQNKQPEKTLAALNDYKHIFPRNELPDELSRLKSYALLHSGHLAQAAREAQGLFEREKSAENLLALVETARHTDDLFSINRAIEQMPALDDLTPKQQLGISHLLSSYNSELASEMWRAVKSQLGESEEIVDSVYFHGQKLGLGREAAMLFPQVLKSAKRGSASSRVMTTEETLDWFRERTTELEELEGLYQTGQFPSHLYCAHRNEPLAELFHVQSRRNLEIESVARKRKIMTRSASRPETLDQVFTRQAEWRFHLDLTSLLLIQELDLLGALEKCSPVFVSSEIIPSINAEIDGFQNTPLDAVAAVQTVLRALETNRCRKLVVSRLLSAEERERHAAFLKDFSEDDLRLLLQAEEEKAKVVVSFPLRNGQSGKIIELTDDFVETTYDWRDVLSALLETDVLTVAQKSIAEAELKKKVSKKSFRPLPPGTHLYLTGRAAGELAKFGLFDETCRVFSITVDERNESALREDVRRFNSEQETVKWLESLKERLRKGFERGTYQGISLGKLKEIEPDNEKTGAIDYRERSIREILLLAPEADDAVVVDDRFISRHAAVESTAPLFTVYELLEYLKMRGFLTEEEYFVHLIRLRERNFRYLSLTSGEIIYHFRRATPAAASLDDSRFNRSRELAALRRYFSDCLLDEKLLQRPAPSAPGQPNSLGEMRFILGCERAVTEAVGRVWREADSLEAARGQADLLLFDFYVGSFNLRHFFEDFTALEAGAYHLASDFVSLSFQGVNLFTAETLTPDERQKRAAAFFDWVNQIFNVKFRLNPQIVEHTVNILVNALTFTFASLPAEETGSDLDKAQRAALVAVYAQFINFLPEIISRPLFETDSLWRNLPAPQAVVTISKMKFNAAELWDACAEALAGNSAVLQLYSGSKRIFAATRDTENPKLIAVRMTDKNGEFFRLTGSFVGLQLPNAAERETFLLGLGDAFDCPKSEMQKAINEIAALSEPSARAARYNEWANRSMQLKYENLSNEVRDQKQFRWSQIIEMPVDSLPKHFRFEPSQTDNEFRAEEFDEAAARLLNDEGLETALDRCARFPRRLPEVLLVELQKLEDSARISMLKKLRAGWHSPIHKLHYIYLILKVLPDDEETVAAARKAASELFRPEVPNEENLEFEIFNDLLELIGEEFSRSPTTRKWTTGRRLALVWAHAAKIYNCIAPIADSRAEQTKLLVYFNSMRPFWSSEALSFEPDYWRDCLHPRFLEREFFAAFASGHLFAEFPSDVLERIKLPKLLAELCFAEMEGDRVPHYALWKDFSLRTNVAESFLGAENLELFYSLVSTEEVKFYEPGVMNKYLDTVLDKLSENPQIIEIWFELPLLSDDLPLAENAGAKFNRAIEKTDFAELWETDEEGAWFVLGIAAAYNTILPAGLQEKIEGWLISATGRLADKYPARMNQRMNNREEQVRIAFRIVDIAARLSVIPLDSTASSRNWNRLIERLGGIWSNLHVWLEPFLFRCWTDLSVEQMQGLGRNLLLAKAIR